MDFTGNIIAEGRRSGGTTKDGKAWTSQEYVLETIERYPQRVVFSVTGENIDKFGIKEGQRLKISVDFHATRNEQRQQWYNNVRCWAAEHLG